MQIIIAPAKKMTVDTDSFATRSMPQFIRETAAIFMTMKAWNYEQAKQIWQTSDRLTRSNFNYLQQMRLDGPLTPAVMAYVGIQYQSMAPDLLTKPQLDYLQGHLRIMSGFYGLLRPFDGIVPYRLEMQARLQIGIAKNLYAFWGSKLHDALDFTHGPVINLASQEYTKAVRPFLSVDEQLVDIEFGRLENGRVKMRATRAKMARGAMVRYMAVHNVDSVKQIEAFDDPDYQFAAELSTPTKLVFIER